MAVGLDNWFIALPAVRELNDTGDWPSSMSAVLEMTPLTFGKRRILLLPPSATHRSPDGSSRTPDPLPTPFGSQKHSVDAVGFGTDSQLASPLLLPLHRLPVKSA